MFRICLIVSRHPRVRLGERTADVADEKAALPDAGEESTSRARDLPEELDPRPLHDGVGFGGAVLVVRAEGHRESGIGNRESGTGEAILRCGIRALLEFLAFGSRFPIPDSRSLRSDPRQHHRSQSRRTPRSASTPQPPAGSDPLPPTAFVS